MDALTEDLVVEALFKAAHRCDVLGLEQIIHSTKTATATPGNISRWSNSDHKDLINIVNCDQETLLMTAILAPAPFSMKFPTTQWLLSNGADVSMTTKIGETVLHLAVLQVFIFLIFTTQNMMRVRYQIIMCCESSFCLYSYIQKLKYDNDFRDRQRRDLNPRPLDY